MSYAVGVDIGGAKVAAAVMDSQGPLREKAKVPTGHDGTRKSIDQVAEVVRRAVEPSNVWPREISSAGKRLFWRAWARACWRGGTLKSENAGRNTAVRKLLHVDPAETPAEQSRRKRA